MEEGVLEGLGSPFMLPSSIAEAFSGYELHRAPRNFNTDVTKWPEEWRRCVDGKLFVTQDIPTQNDWLLLSRAEQLFCQFGDQVPADFLTIQDGIWRVDFAEALRREIQYYDPRMYKVMKYAVNVPKMLKTWREKTHSSYRSLRCVQGKKKEFSDINVVPIVIRHTQNQNQQPVETSDPRVDEEGIESIEANIEANVDDQRQEFCTPESVQKPRSLTVTTITPSGEFQEMEDNRMEQSDKPDLRLVLEHAYALRDASAKLLNSYPEQSLSQVDEAYSLLLDVLTDLHSFREKHYVD